MALVVEKDKSFDPVDVGFFRPRAIVPHADRVADLVKELRLLRRRGVDCDDAPRAASVNRRELGQPF
jgi:hypothetical protein